LAIEEQNKRKKPEQSEPEPGAGEEERKAGAVVQERGEESKPEGTGEELRGKAQEEVAKSAKKPLKNKVERLRANAVEKRLKAGEDVPDEQVKKFKTLSLRWSRNEDGKWEEHEPEYLAKVTMTEEERERRADLRAVNKAIEENKPSKIAASPIDAWKKAQKELARLKKELEKETDPDKRADLQNDIISTRQDVRILASRVSKGQGAQTKIRWFGEAEDVEALAPEHPLKAHRAFQPPEMSREQIEYYTEVEPDTGQRMLKQMHPTTMPRALATMINYAMHFGDGSVNLQMVSTFLKQLNQGLTQGKLDNYLKTPEDKQDFLGELDTAQDLLKQVVAQFIGISREVAEKNEQNVVANNEMLDKEKPLNENKVEQEPPATETRDEELARLMAEQEADDIGKEPTPRFTRSTTERKLRSTTPGIGINRTLKYVEEFTQMWNNAPVVVVVDTRAALPDNIKEYITEEDANNRIGGVQYGDTVFMIADELANREEVGRILLHEAVGHYGVIETLGETFEPTAIGIYESFKDSAKMQEIRKAYLFDPTTAEGKRDLGAEYLAYMAEENIGSPVFWERIAKKVMDALRTIGLDIKLTTIDVKHLLADSHKFVHGEQKKSNVENFFSNTRMPQPGFVLTPEMKRSVVEKGQPWFSRNKQPAILTKAIEYFGVYDHVKDVGNSFLLPNGKFLQISDHYDIMALDPQYNDLIDDFGSDEWMEASAEAVATFIADTGSARIIVSPIGSNRYALSIESERPLSRTQFKSILALDQIYEFGEQFHWSIGNNYGSGNLDKFRQQIAKEFSLTPEPKFSRIVDFHDETQPQDKTAKNLFDDHAYAMLKTLAAQLPKNQPAMHAVEKYLLSPEWYKHPVMGQIVKQAIERHDRYYELFNQLNELGTDKVTKKPIDWQGETNVIDATVKLRNKGLNKAQLLKGETSQEYKDFERMVDEIDTGTWKTGYDKSNLPSWETHYASIPKEVKDLYKLHRASYDKALDLLLAPMNRLLAEIDAEAKRTNTKPKYPQFVTYDDHGNITHINLRQVIEQMGQLRGTYAPRLREQGEWVVKGKRGEKVIRYHKPNRLSAELLKRELERKGYKVEPIHERERLPEDVYSTLRIINTAKAIEHAVQGTSTNDPELMAKFTEELLQNVADLVRVRGFRSSMVHRRQDTVVGGYITDPNERFVRYTNNIAAGIAKAEAAEKMFKTLAGSFEGKGEDKKRVGGIDPAKEPRAYNTATQYITEQLRNSDATDRLIGLMKSFATFKYLGFSLRAPMVNILALVTTVPTSIHQYVMGGKGSITKINKEIAQASIDYIKAMRGQKLLNVDEQLLIDEIKTKGYDSPQYTRDALGTIQRSYSKAWARTLYWAMYIFGKSEQWIRGATILAAYRLARAKNMDHTEAAEVAHDASNKAHGVYGKATQLAVGQGTGPGARLAQVLYTFSKFPHNYLQMLYDVGMRQGNIKGFLYGFLSPIFLGGAAVIPMKDAIVKVVGMMLSAMGAGDDPEKWFWDKFRKQFGKTAERVARHGALGALNIDVSGSMSIGVGIPKDFYELFGIAGGLTKDFLDAKHFLETGQVGRTFEKTLPTSMGNIFKAIRELNGVTTTKGQRVWNDKGEPYVPSNIETGMRVVGIRSAEEATMTERTWETKREIKRFADIRNSILEQWRDYIVTKGDKDDLKKIMDKINKYNDMVMRSGKTGEIPVIKRDTLKSQAKALSRPNKSMYVGMFQ